MTEAKDHKILKILVWTYFWLLIFEGALRKWFLPGLATPLLIVRDPVAVVAILLGIAKGVLRWNGFLATSMLIAIPSLVMTMVLGHGDVVVALYGLRTNFLHLPLIFLIGELLSAKDLRKMSLCWMALGIGMLFLIFLQFHAPAGSGLNVGIGGEGDSGFDGALGFRRPSGTFSFNNGVSMFFAVVAAFCLSPLLSPGPFKGKILAFSGGLSVLAAIPISISRGLLVSVIIVGAGAAVAMLAVGRGVARVLGAIFGMALLLVASTFLPGMETPREVFMSRWTAATTDQGGFGEAIVKRVTDDLADGLSRQSFLEGFGIGAGTNVGAQKLTGEQVFLISEGEWGRLTGEMGWPLGMLFIILRVVLASKLLMLAVRACRHSGDPLPILLWFAVAPFIVNGQWGQPTALGFAALGGGLVLASARTAQLETGRLPVKNPAFGFSG